MNVEALNAQERERKNNLETQDRLSSLLIAVYRLPLKPRKLVLEQYETNYQNIITERMRDDLNFRPEPFIEQQDTQEADFERTQREERADQEANHPKD